MVRGKKNSCWFHVSHSAYEGMHQRGKRVQSLWGHVHKGGGRVSNMGYVKGATFCQQWAEWSPFPRDNTYFF
mgnify:CR=1 FL=1